MGTTTLCQKNVTSHETNFTFCDVIFLLSKRVYPACKPFGESGDDIERGVKTGEGSNGSSDFVRCREVVTCAVSGDEDCRLGGYGGLETDFEGYPV